MVFIGGSDVCSMLLFVFSFCEVFFVTMVLCIVVRLVFMSCSVIMSWFVS